MPLADDFQAVVDTLPPDWTQLELDMRIFDEDRYIEAATLMVQINALPYSQADWHWRIRVAHEFGHAAAARYGGADPGVIGAGLYLVCRRSTRT